MSKNKKYYLGIKIESMQIQFAKRISITFFLFFFFFLNYYFICWVDFSWFLILVLMIYRGCCYRVSYTPIFFVPLRHLICLNSSFETNKFLFFCHPRSGCQTLKANISNVFITSSCEMNWKNSVERSIISVKFFALNVTSANRAILVT